MSEHDELFDAMNFSMDQKIFLAVDDDDRIISTLETVLKLQVSWKVHRHSPQIAADLPSSFFFSQISLPFLNVRRRPVFFYAMPQRTT